MKSRKVVTANCAFEVVDGTKISDFKSPNCFVLVPLGTYIVTDNQHLEHSPQHKPLSVMLDLVWGWGGRAIIYIGYIGKYPHVLSVAFRRCGNIYIHAAFKDATRTNHVSRR